jgi:SAM-dependent methyltransferase
MDAERFLASIQVQIDSTISLSNGSAGAVHFFPPESLEKGGDLDFGDDFNEEDYLISNPDVIGAIERGEATSGFDHWMKSGKSEGRTFAPVTFGEHEYLALNPDAAHAVLSGEFKSGRDHWLRRGRLEGRSIRKSAKTFMPHAMRQASELQDRVSQIGEVPQGPNTLRGAIGRRVILVMGRLLWWYTRSLVAFAEGLTKQLHSHVMWLERLESTQERERGIVQSMHEMITNVSAEQRTREFRLHRLEADARSLFKFKEHLEKTQEQDRQMLQTIHEMVAGFSTRVEQVSIEQSSRIEELSRAVGAFQPGWTSDHSLDSVYFAFEEAFRGSREEIKKRLTVYLPFLAQAHAGTPQRPALDLGCGRGEWIELLSRRHMTVRGVDSNSAMAGFCRSLGLDVEQDDFLGYLRRLPDCCLGVVTSFHMVEHLPFNLVTALLNESMRVLMPGGLLILETPNPKNLIVASHNFYLDPTHLKPLPPAMLQFFIQASGFSNCQVLELHPASVPAGCEGVEASRYLSALFWGPQDYGIVAVRP